MKPQPLDTQPNCPDRHCLLAAMRRLWLPLLVVGLVVPPPVSAQAPSQAIQNDPDTVASISGQFLISRVDGNTGMRPNLNLLTETNLLRLKPAVLAVDAEHFKHALWHQLNLPPNFGWSGKIEIALYPAQSADDQVTIASVPFLDHWNYRVNLPDRISPVRFARTLTGVLLLELANRQTPRFNRSAEVPAWLVDGMAQQVLGTAADSVLFSAPVAAKGSMSFSKSGVAPDWLLNDEQMPIARLSRKERGLDPLAATRQVVQGGQPLTFDQLSWPTYEQMSGADGGSYYASAQLFVAELLALRNGPGQLGNMLAELPGCLNWQTAFFQAFAAEFKRPLDVEKWWALRTIVFAQRDPGPQWTAATSVTRLHDLLLVPVDFRGQSNALPTHAEIPLQNALESLAPEERDQVIRTKTRDLALAEIRMARPFGALANAYRMALADFLGDLRKTRVTTVNKHGVPPSVGASVRETIGRLNFLDARRQEAENRLYAAASKSPAGPATPLRLDR
jgi:hypothetical protein